MFRLREVLELEIFNGSSILAGESGLDNEVTFVTVMDVPTIVDWIHEGEMLLVAKQFVDYADKAFFDQLRNKSVSAIVAKPSFAPALTPDILEHCSQIGLPIISVPAKISWSDIINPVTQLFARSQYEAIYQSQQFHATLMKSLIKGASLDQICKDIHRVSGISIAITDKNFMLLGCSQNVAWHDILFDFSITKASYTQKLGINAEGKPVSGYHYVNATLKNQRKHALIFPARQDRMTLGYVFIIQNADCAQLDVNDSMKIDQICLVCSLYVIKQQEMNNAIRRYNNLLLDRIMISPTLGEREREEIQALIQQRFHSGYYIALAELPGGYRSLHLQRQAISQLFDSIRSGDSALDDVLCFERGTYLVFFIPESNPDITHAVNTLQSKCHEIIGEPVRLGISEPTQNQFPKAYGQALQALGTISPEDSTTFRFYGDLGIMRFFMDKAGSLDETFLEDIERRYLKPLDEYDSVHQTELKHTLMRYIANNCSSVKTQNELFIHKNTLRARLARIERLLCCSLSSSEDLFNIQMAIKISQYKGM